MNQAIAFSGPKHVSSLVMILACSLLASPLLAQNSDNLLKNGDFELTPMAASFGWSGSSTAQGSLAMSAANTISGRSSLQLTPTTSNTGTVRNGNLFGIGQAMPASPLAGQALHLSGWLHAEGQSTALLHIYAMWNNGRTTLQELRQTPAGAPVRRRDVFVVPKDAAYIIVLCLVEGTSGAAYFDDIRLSVGQSADWPEVLEASDQADKLLDAEISVNAGRHVRHIPPTLYGTNIEWIWDGNGIWDAAAGALNPEIVSLTREMAPTLHRFPGGTFSDFYNWMDAIGPQATRPTVESMPGGIVSAHRFGTDEALEFADATNSKLLLTVNVVTGTPEQAADWVRYVNKNGRRVEYWEIGNESYVMGDTLPASASVLTPEEYTRRFLLFARAMKAVDPGIKVGAIADENYSRSFTPYFGNWTEHLLRTAASEIDFIAVHCGYAPAIWEDKGWNARTVYSAFLAAPQLIREHLETLTARIEELAPNRDIKIAVTEWGPFFDSSRESRFIDHTKTLGSALFVAGTLKAFIESGLTEVANLFKLTDAAAYMALIGTRQGSAIPKATSLAFQMFTRNFGTELVESSTRSPVYDSPAVGWVDAAQTPYVEAIASTDADRKYLYIVAINKNFDAPIRSRISINDYDVHSHAEVITLNGTALDANTGTELVEVPGFDWAKQAEIQPQSRFYSGSPDEVTIVRSATDHAGNSFEYVLPPHSVTSFVLRIQEPGR